MLEVHVPGIMEAGSFCGTPMQLRQAVLDQITTYPETHDQWNWISDCGTTACVAGWALMFQDGFIPQSNSWGVLHAAKRLLDLSAYDAVRLFHYTTNEQARMALKFLANGEAVDWEAVGHKLEHNHNAEQLDYLIRHDLIIYGMQKVE